MGFLPSLGLLLLEIVLPVILSGLFLYWLSGALKLWRLNQLLAQIIFIALFIIISLAACIVIDGFTLAARKKSRYKRFINPVSRRARLVKYLVIGILIPSGVIAAANLVNLPQGGTPMTMAVNYSQLAANVTPAAGIGNAVLGSSNPSTKIQGIKALQAIHSTDSLDQLFRILTSDSMAMNDAGEYAALSGAIASFGTQAKTGLFDLYANPAKLQYKPSVAADPQAFSWYFSAPFDELRKGVQASNADPAQQQADLRRLDAAETSLEQSLAGINLSQPAPSASASIAAFVVRTFLAMEIGQDKDLLNFARTVAADPAQPDSVRGEAMLLMAKIGGKDELNDLYSYLGSSSELVKARALEAIAGLQSGEPAPAP